MCIRVQINPIIEYRVYSPVTLIGYGNDNDTEIAPQFEENNGIYVLVNKMKDPNGNKVNKNFQEEEGEELKLPAEARKIELQMHAPDDGESGTASYSVKLKLESDDAFAAEKVAIWQVPEDAEADEQKKWEMKVGGIEAGDPGVMPNEPVLTMKEGDAEKTLTFYLEGRGPMTGTGTQVRLVAEMYKGSDNEPMARDKVVLNPLEVSYLRPSLMETTEDLEILNCATVPIGSTTAPNMWISELMTDPGPDHAQWVELHNPSAEEVTFTSDHKLQSNGVDYPLTGFTIEAYGYLVVASNATIDGLGNIPNVVTISNLVLSDNVKLIDDSTVLMSTNQGETTTGVSRYYAYEDSEMGEQVWMDSTLSWEGSGDLLGSPGSSVNGGSTNRTVCDTMVIPDGRKTINLRCPDSDTMPGPDEEIEACKDDYSNTSCWCEILPEQLLATDAEMLRKWAETGGEYACASFVEGWMDAVPDSNTCGFQVADEAIAMCKVPMNLTNLLRTGGNGVFRMRVTGLDLEQVEEMAVTGYDAFAKPDKLTYKSGFGEPGVSEFSFSNSGTLVNDANELFVYHTSPAFEPGEKEALAEFSGAGAQGLRLFDDCQFSWMARTKNCKGSVDAANTTYCITDMFYEKYDNDDYVRVNTDPEEVMGATDSIGRLVIEFQPEMKDMKKFPYTVEARRSGNSTGKYVLFRPGANNDGVELVENTKLRIPININDSNFKDNLEATMTEENDEIKGEFAVFDLGIGEGLLGQKSNRNDGIAMANKALKSGGISRGEFWLKSEIEDKHLKDRTRPYAVDSCSAMNHGGVFIIQWRAGGAFTRTLFRQQADIIYYSGHGHHATGNIHCLEEGRDVTKNGTEFDWSEDVDTAIFSACSVIDFNNSGKLTSPGMDSPALEWINNGAKHYLGYRSAAPEDQVGDLPVTYTDDIIEDWMDHTAGGTRGNLEKEWINAILAKEGFSVSRPGYPVSPNPMQTNDAYKDGIKAMGIWNASGYNVDTGEFHRLYCPVWDEKNTGDYAICKENFIYKVTQEQPQ